MRATAPRWSRRAAAASPSSRATARLLKVTDGEDLALVSTWLGVAPALPILEDEFDDDDDEDDDEDEDDGRGRRGVIRRGVLRRRRDARQRGALVGRARGTGRASRRTSIWAALGAVVDRGERHSLAAWELLGVERPEGVGFEAADLYDDAEPCLRRLRADGYFVGLAGNVGRPLEPFVERFGLDVDFAAASHTLGAEKPSPRFFERLLETVGRGAGRGRLRRRPGRQRRRARRGGRDGRGAHPPRAVGLSPERRPSRRRCRSARSTSCPAVFAGV